jgi:hypothetical protein
MHAHTYTYTHMHTHTYTYVRMSVKTVSIVRCFFCIACVDPFHRRNRHYSEFKLEFKRKTLS